MKIYHYASINSWRDIKSGSWQSADEPGLGACLRVCKDYYEDRNASKGAVFGLLEPEPDSWKYSNDYPVVWQRFMSHVGRLLLAYEPTDEIIEKSFVIDWCHKERGLGGHKDDLGKSSDEKISLEKRLSAEKAYWESRVPLADYIDHPRAIAGIVLPEVITMGNIPFTIIEIADQQPRLQNLNPFARDDLLLEIEQNTELGVLSAHIT